MASQEGARLAQKIRQRVKEIENLCEGLDEATVSRAPEGRWSPKMILSHLCGPEDVGLISALQLILQQDTPQINLDPGNPHFSGKRSKMTLAELLIELKGKYERIADLVAGLSDEQLARRAYVPDLKETPLGEYLTMGVFVGALVEDHMGYHRNHLSEILQALGVNSSKR